MESFREEDDDSLEEASPSTPWHPFDSKLLWNQLLSDNVRHFRRLKNLSQESLAEQSGIFRTYLSRIETGKCNPSLSVLVALANALEIPPYALLMPIDEV